MTQPEAERLANALQQQAVWEGHYGPGYLRDLLPEAAAELRRLHAENEALREANEAFGKRQEWWNEKMFAIEQQRDAMQQALKALEKAVVAFGPGLTLQQNAITALRAAIKQAEGEKS